MAAYGYSPGKGPRYWIWLGVLVLAACLYLLRDVLPPFLIAFAIALLLDPLLNRMQRWGWSRRAATVVVFGLFLLAFAAVASRAEGSVGGELGPGALAGSDANEAPPAGI